MSKIENIKSKINENGVVVIDFFATWCGPCQMFLPVFDEVSQELENVTFFKVDIDQDIDYAVENNVTGVPTVVIYKDGNKVDEFSGFKNKDDLIAKIKEHSN